MATHGQDPAGTPLAPAVGPGEQVPLTRWQKFRLVVKVVELRLRFIVLMAATGLTFAYWDSIWNHYDKWMRPATDQHIARAGVEYYCPMHPAVVQDEPGQCPICGMPLAKRQVGERAPLGVGVTARVRLGPSRVRQAGIRTAAVQYAPLAQTLTTVGYVAFDERRLANVVSKAPGQTRVEVLHVNYTGMEVTAGQPLAELYSPELTQAVAELRTAQRAERESAGLQTAAARSLLGDRRLMVELATEKLKRWGITDEQVNSLLQGGEAEFKIPILSPISGTVVGKNVVEGQEVGEGFAMFEIAALSRVWIQARVYEHQIGLVHEGEAVEATVEAFPGQTFPGSVAFIQPTLDPATRTVEVRFDLANPERRLRPGMFATVKLTTPVVDTPAFQGRLATRPHTHAGAQPASLTVEEQATCPVTNLKLGSMGKPIPVEVAGRQVWTCCQACPPQLKAQPAKFLARLDPGPGGEVLSVPEAAVIDTGKRKVVYVEVEPGVFEGRVVVLGTRIGNRYPVLEGLAPGEEVAAAGAFLIDAESRLNPAPSSRADPVTPEIPQPQAPPQPHVHPTAMPARTASVARPNSPPRR